MNLSASAPAPGSGVPAPGSSHGPAIDPATLARLYDLDPGGQAGIVLRVLRTYDGALASALAGIAAASDASDAGTLRLLTHTLKSSSASVGALRLAALCGESEAIAREGWSAELPPLCARLLDEGLRVQAALRHMLPEAG